MTTSTRPIKAEEWLSEIGRRIDALADRSGIDKLGGELRTWKGRVEELRVQAALGAMEARDRVAPLLHRIEVALRDVERLFAEAGDGEIVDEEALAKEVRGAMANLDKEIAAADELR